MDFSDLLKKPIAKKGPDLFLTPPEHEGIKKMMAYQIMNKVQIKDFERNLK